MKLVLDLSAKTNAALQNIFAMIEDKNLIVATDTPYTTVIHNDMWINNVMVRKGTKSN